MLSKMAFSAITSATRYYTRTCRDTGQDQVYFSMAGCEGGREGLENSEQDEQEENYDVIRYYGSGGQNTTANR